MTHDKSNGFTLVETVIVLFLFSTLVSLPLLSFHSFNKSQQAEHVARLFKEDIVFAQHMAMTEGRNVNLSIIQWDQHYKVVTASTGTVHFQRRFPVADMYFVNRLPGTGMIEFLPNGHPRRAGTIDLHVGSKRYRYTIMIGKGKVTYVEV